VRIRIDHIRLKRHTGGNSMFKVLTALAIAVIWCSGANAQSKSAKDQIIGAWILESVTSEMADGTKGEPFGAAPKGIIIFSADGHFSLFQSRADVPTIAANDRAKATGEEAQAIVASAIAYYGSYAIDDDSKTMVVNLAASTYANIAAMPNQKRIITSLTADELRFDNPRTPNGMTLRTAWKRVSGP
jgi:Lipocalin-like domain